LYQHYLDAIHLKRPYSEIPGVKWPNNVTYPNATNASYYNQVEYAPGSELPTPPGKGNNTKGVMVDCKDQLLFASDPRFNSSAIEKHGTGYNFNWMDPSYMAGQGQPAERKVLANFTIAIMEVLAQKWRYGTMVIGRPSKTSIVYNASIALANAHPDRPLHMIINRREDRNSSLFNQSLPQGCYMQNAKGDFITVMGEPVVPPKGKKCLRPMSPSLAEKVGCPDSVFNRDGEYHRDRIFRPLIGMLTRPVDIINADGEIFISLATPGEYYNFSRDPVVYADFTASGAVNWETFWSEWRTRLTCGWRDVFMQDSLLLKAGVVGANSSFSMYQVQGSNDYFGNWSVTREIGTPDQRASRTGRYLSTEDVYLQHPGEWWLGGGPDHGIQWTQMTRRSEIEAGDDIFTPFVASGWSGKAERNLRPAQWLGLLKIMAAWGAEWFYAGFFSLAAPFPPSQNWCWQAMMPSYAQALMTQYADFFYRGQLVRNDPNTTFAMSDGGVTGSPLLWAGTPNILCIARRLEAPSGSIAYLITATIQRLANAKGSADTMKARLSIPGLRSPTGDRYAPILFTARSQGTVGVYRNDSLTKRLVFTQLDTWHLASHPLTWPGSSPSSLGAGREESALYEAELFEGWNEEGAPVATDLIGQPEHELDFSLHVTYLLLREARGNEVCIRVASQGVVKEARARARRGTVNGVTAQGREWRWLTVPAGGSLEAGLVCLSGDAEVDQVAVAARPAAD